PSNGSTPSTKNGRRSLQERNSKIRPLKQKYRKCLTEKAMCFSVIKRLKMFGSYIFHDRISANSGARQTTGYGPGIPATFLFSERTSRLMAPPPNMQKKMFLISRRSI